LWVSDEENRDETYPYNNGLSSPIDTGIPGRERAVANHLSIFAKKSMR